MFSKRSFCLLLSLCALLGTAATAEAAQVESGAAYCFSPEDFAREEALTGICITDLPRAEGILYLGSRILQPGDILTAEQSKAASRKEKIIFFCKFDNFDSPCTLLIIICILITKNIHKIKGV